MSLGNKNNIGILFNRYERNKKRNIIIYKQQQIQNKNVQFYTSQN